MLRWEQCSDKFLSQITTGLMYKAPYFIIKKLNDREFTWELVGKNKKHFYKSKKYTSKNNALMSIASLKDILQSKAQVPIFICCGKEKDYLIPYTEEYLLHIIQRIYGMIYSYREMGLSLEGIADQLGIGWDTMRKIHSSDGYKEYVSKRDRLERELMKGEK